MRRVVRRIGIGWIALILAVNVGCSSDIARQIVVDQLFGVASSVVGAASSSLVPALLQSLMSQNAADAGAE